MSASHDQHINTIEGAGINPDQPHGTKDIWKTFWILFILTIVDIAFYFAVSPSMFRNWVFIFLGIVKAYFIVGVFMHMKYERKNLIQTIILPVLFILGLIATCIYEGNFWDSININLD
ncbi:MAG: cytochrome C oxidase subunit IV family protein [Bacteroidia bacterium]|nr:cytochrome C oxidase subunit IV family protein [Bacteroidia bacterium]MBP7259912.1 cytochrome C oxidase subunit IV family protein [Bacteroidia bacterium]MBP9179981.1 cytochrome C oxidase subunit IV family protein [Bacteroidia bacterium]MBP9723449.1 cytochrome C oxidase subunit IV family protein [Bacteroidia bacterium]